MTMPLSMVSSSARTCSAARPREAGIILPAGVVAMVLMFSIQLTRGGKCFPYGEASSLQSPIFLSMVNTFHLHISGTPLLNPSLRILFSHYVFHSRDFNSFVIRLLLHA